MAKMVTRTFVGHEISFEVKIAKEINGKTELVNEVIKLYVDEPKTDKAIKKACTEMLGKGIMVGCTVVEQVRGVTVEEFYKLSVPVERAPSQQPSASL